LYNYKLTIEYDGLNFNGWQKQKYTSNTIQEQIETSIEKLLRKEIKLIAAGRTDSGVSAHNQVANFKSHDKLDIMKFAYSLNSVLPETILIKKVLNVPLNFHSRYSAKKRDYVYKVTTKKKSLGRHYYYKIGFDPDFKNIDTFFSFLKKQKNFGSLCKNGQDKKNFICEIFDLNYRQMKSKNEILFFISANRFLHSMVRAIFGCALEIGRGKIDIKNIKDKIKSGEKIPVHYLPANALFLNKIHY